MIAAPTPSEMPTPPQLWTTPVPFSPAPFRFLMGDVHFVLSKEWVYVIRRSLLLSRTDTKAFRESDGNIR